MAKVIHVHLLHNKWYIMHETRYNQAIYAYFMLSWGR